MHHILKAEDTRPPAANLAQQHVVFERFCREYNQVRPHEGIGLQTPASLYRSSQGLAPTEPLPLVYPAHFKTRLISKNSGIR
jgi:hypothetical protein